MSKKNWRNRRDQKDFKDDEKIAESKTKSDDKAKPGPGFNDISWYTRYPLLTQASSSVAYPYRPGMKMGLWIDESSTDAQAATYYIPGVCTINWAPSIGLSENATDPASLVGKEIYGRVRKVYSGSLRADAPDYVIYLMALDSLFSYIAWLKRLYRLLTAWTPNNYMFPDRVVSALTWGHTTATSLLQDRMALWGYINDLVYQSRKFTAPASMDIFNRHYWMNDNIFTDANMANSQIYLLNQKWFYKYYTTKSPQNVDVGGCQNVSLEATLSNVTDGSYAKALYNFGLDLINALVAWDDAYTINGYLQRAYEGEPLFGVTELAQDEVVAPIYSEEVLSQIENSTSVLDGEPQIPTSYTFHNTIYQDPTTNAVLCFPYLIASTNMPMLGSQMNVMMSSRMESPTILDNVLQSRLKCFTRLQTNLTRTIPKFAMQQDEDIYGTGSEGTDVKAATQYTYDIYSGTEIVLERTLHFNYSSGSTAKFDLPYVINSAGSSSALKEYIGYRLAVLSQWDWAPLTLISSKDGETQTSLSIQPVCDVHNVTVMSGDELNEMHRVCILSELNAFNVY